MAYIRTLLIMIITLIFTYFISIVKIIIINIDINIIRRFIIIVVTPGVSF